MVDKSNDSSECDAKRERRHDREEFLRLAARVASVLIGVAFFALGVLQMWTVHDTSAVAFEHDLPQFSKGQIIRTDWFLMAGSCMGIGLLAIFYVVQSWISRSRIMKQLDRLKSQQREMVQMQERFERRLSEARMKEYINGLIKGGAVFVSDDDLNDEV